MSTTTQLTPTRFTRSQRAGSWLTLAVFLCAPLPASGTETALGEVQTSVGSGDFTINQPDVTEFTQHSQSVILDWQNDIQQPAYHSLEFRQQDSFVVLNRSPGERAANFFGRVVCDATCIFANEAGITFHDGAFIDVGRMIAVAGNIASEDFVSGNLHFTNLTGAVHNYATMQGDSISLLGRSVANFGHISTTDGAFMMLAGDEVWIRDHDSPIVIQTSLDAPEPGGDGSRFADQPAVENAGHIEARGGHVRLAAGDMLSFAIRQSGSIEADEIVLEGGAEGLVEVSGRLDASHEQDRGGTIHVLGDYVSIQAGADIDASGSGGGGQIWIGGGPQGRAAVRNARGTFVHEDAGIRADAEIDGDGGEIVVWADETAQIHGTLSAQGGRLAGDGGFAETSGKLWLDVTRAPNLRARSGLASDRGGHWLIDPNSIEIVASGCGDAPECLDEGLSAENRRNPNFDQSAIRPTVDDSKITAEVIAEALEQGSNVTILTDTIAEEQGTQDGNITVNAAIYVNDAAAQAGTEVTLALLAANDIEINADIAVTKGKPAPGPSPTKLPSDEPGFIDLDIFLVAGDARQAQAPDVPGEIPQEFQGDLHVNADLWTGGGDVGLGGVNVTIASNVDIDTDGGTVDIGGGPIASSTGLLLGAVGGDLIMRGTIDTSTDVLDEATGDPFAGGAVVMRAAAVNREATSDADSPLVLVGGHMQIRGDVTSGGGLILADTVAGNLTLTSKLDSGGGAVVLQSQQLEVDLQDGAANIPAGGRITVDESATILSGGNTVTLGTADPLLGPTANEIVLRGQIDSRVYDSGSPVDDEVGGAVTLNTFNTFALDGEILGNGARVIVQGSDGTQPTVITNGGRFESRGDGSFFLEDATIDVSADVTTPEDNRDSVLVIDHAGRVDILTDDGVSRLLADSVIEIAPNPGRFADAAFGVPTPGFGTSDVRIAGDVTLQSDEIFILAGDGYAGVGTNAEVELLGNVVFQRVTDTMEIQSPLRVTVLQDADLDSEDVTSRLVDGVSNMQRYELGASDGLLTIRTIKDLSATNTDELALVLNAKDGIDFASSLVDSDFASLDIQINEGFTIDQDFADNINGAADNVSITTGNQSNFDAADLIVEGVLEADNELVLHAGSAGDGNLSFTSTAGIQAQQIVLFAGNGDNGGEATVDMSGLVDDAINFVDPNPPVGEAAPSFELRQDAAITDSVIPTAGVFADGVVGVAYTLRSENGGITIGDITGDTERGAEALLDTDLRLYAESDIVLDEPIRVQALDIGGLLSFQFTQELYKQIQFSDDATSKLTLRAGLRRGDGVGGILSFGVFDRGDDPNTPDVVEEDTPIEAAEIRLVAGDGMGGDGVGSGTSLIQLISDPEDLIWGQPNNDTPQFKGRGGQPLTFVFRQDGPITQSMLPSTTSNFDATSPDSYAIRSDDGGITIDRFDPADTSLPPDDQLPRAHTLLVLSGTEVDIVRSDGTSLNFDTDLDPVGGGDLAAMQIRTHSLGLSATYDQAGIAPEVLPGSTLQLSGFDLLLS
ncbi:MAG: hypothetical protein JRE70_14165, partial [Deltaproteobacteria bacterium]|nr:hypothetical protein [Deltaproteobacteria bacterium]